MKKRQPPLTSVLIVCWNAPEMTRVCLEQLERWTHGPFELILVDNGSRRPTASWLARFARRRPSAGGGQPLRRVVLRRNASNLGYPAAMNQALEAARGEYVVFGNPDVAVGPGWLEGMRAALDSAPDVGGVLPFSNPIRLRGQRPDWSFPPNYRDLRGMAAFAFRLRFHPWPSIFEESKSRLPGFWFMTRRAILRKTGGFDERFWPGGYEDHDLHDRIRAAGFRLGFAPKAYVHHLWFACCEENSVSPRSLYSPRRSRGLRGAAGGRQVRFEIKVPTWTGVKKGPACYESRRARRVR